MKNIPARHFLLRVILPLLLLCAAPAHAQDDNEPPIQPGDIMPYLEQVIAWQHTVSGMEALPDNSRESILKDKLRSLSQKALQKSFDFARAQTVVFNAQNNGAPAVPAASDRQARLRKALADVNQRIDQLQSDLKNPGLSADDREKYAGQLKLAQAQQDLLQTMTRIFSAPGDRSGSLLDQINALSARSAYGPTETATPLPKTEDSRANTRNSDIATSGMLKLSGMLFSLSRKRDDMHAIIKQTSDLLDTNHHLALSIRTALRSALAEGNALSLPAGKQTQGKGGMVAEYRQSIDTLITRYKQLSATIVPIGEMNLLLEETNKNLQEWESLIEADWTQVLRQLLMRVAVLSIAIAVPLIISAMARRTIERYVQDTRRRRQLRIVRRAVLSAVLALVILANFMTEFGSLATFAGFITAGLAVALQTVLVSLVAHFFYFGRYGVRVGDRVTVDSVTGDVVQIGMLRLYLRELKETDKGWKPSGKLVAFPNSILFQPAAFYKQLDE